MLDDLEAMGAHGVVALVGNENPEVVRTKAGHAKALFQIAVAPINALLGGAHAARLGR